MSTPRYAFNVRDDVDCLVTAVVAENPALRVIGESQGFDEVMQTILVAGCLYLRQREGITPDPDAPVHEIAKAARLLGMHLAVKGTEVVVVPVGTPGCRPMAVVDRDAYDQTDAMARSTDITSDPLRAA